MTMTDETTELPDSVTADAHTLAESLALVAGDEAAVLDIIARTARDRGPEAAAALCVVTLAYTFGRCVVLTDPPSTANPKENP
jgi:hypothetical protein